MTKIILVIISLILGSVSFAQEKKSNLVVPVEIIKNCKDDIGKELASFVNDEIRKYDNMKIAGDDKTKIIVQIYSMDRLPERPNLSSIFSVIWLLKNEEEVFETYLNSEMGIAGKNNVVLAAKRLVATTNEIITEIVKTQAFLGLN